MTANPFDTSSYDDCGFDISHNDGTLDFQQLGSAGGRKFCILKVSEGTTETDDMFVNYMNEIIADGAISRIGVYHFCHHGNTTAQMQHFIQSYVNFKSQISNMPDVLFMLDLERGANPPLESDGIAMVQYLQSIGISNPIIYCGYDYWSQQYPELTSCSHLLAAYNSHPTSAIPWRIASADTYGWDMWQYSGDFLGPWAKDLPGGMHGMDLDCFNLKKHSQGFEAWWDAELAKTTQPS